LNNKIKPHIPSLAPSPKRFDFFSFSFISKICFFFTVQLQTPIHALLSFRTSENDAPLKFFSPPKRKCLTLPDKCLNVFDSYLKFRTIHMCFARSSFPYVPALNVKFNVSHALYACNTCESSIGLPLVALGHLVSEME